MSETKSKDFWPHPSNLRNDRRMKRVMKDLPGAVGYGAVVLTMERLRCEPSYSYPLHDLDLLADEFDISLPILQTVIKNYGFFELVKDKNEEIFFSPVLNELMQPYKVRVEQAKIAGQISAQKRKIKQQKQIEALSLLDSVQQPLNDSTTDKNRLEEKIIDNTILDEKRKYLSLQNFQTFKELTKKKFKNKIVCQAPDGYSSHVTISINSLGFLHNDYSHKDLTREDAIQVWTWIFNNQHLLGKRSLS